MGLCFDRIRLMRTCNHYQLTMLLNTFQWLPTKIYVSGTWKYHTLSVIKHTIYILSYFTWAASISFKIKCCHQLRKKINIFMSYNTFTFSTNISTCESNWYLHRKIIHTIYVFIGVSCGTINVALGNYILGTKHVLWIYFQDLEECLAFHFFLSPRR